MAGSLRIFDNCAVYVQGLLDQDATEVSVSVVDGDEVVTLLGGGSETTVTLMPGGRYLQVQWSRAASQTGDPLDLFKLHKDVARISIRIVQRGSGKSLTTKGFLQDPSLKSSTGSSQSISCSFVGEHADWV